ncbi:MAG: ribonuclease E/G, partial [Alphaproteobacteria bacterium]|nr:ribonuclease E/G [Alphaproteobacteria bacterium]
MEILIEELEGSLWIAAVDQGRLEGIEVDPVFEEVRAGYIYWGKISRIDTALDAAFVDLDGTNTGLLHNADVRIKDKNGSYRKGGAEAIGKALRAGQMVAVQAKDGFIPQDPDHADKDAAKNPRVSMNIALPGRYLIHAPQESDHRVSRRIRDKKMRAQLRAMLDSMAGCDRCILRAAAAGIQTDVLVREGRILKAAWEGMSRYFTGDEPGLIFEGPNAFQRVVADQAGRNISRITVTVMDHFQMAEEWCELYAPDLVTKIVPLEVPGMDVDLALFEQRDLIGAIESLFHPYALLPGGGTVILQETAALIAIDVNRGADTRSALSVNREAAAEIARQIRLRNLGGIVVVDFLKMKKKVEADQLVKALQAAF